MQLVGPVLTRIDVSELSFVLRALDIHHGLTAQPDGYYFIVADGDANRATTALNEYIDENTDQIERSAKEKTPFRSSIKGVLLMLALGIFFLFTGPVANHSPWFESGTAVSQKINQGQIWRAATALTLHADAAHAIGNIASGSIFLTMLSQRLGPGRAVFATFIGGVAGNMANAAYFGKGHASIGASTAVFAAVGALMMTQVAVTASKTKKRWVEKVMPWVGGFTILGMLGAHPNTDITAHLFGLLGGLIVTALIVLPNRKKSLNAKASLVQPAYAFLSLFLILGAWALAFKYT